MFYYELDRIVSLQRAINDINISSFTIYFSKFNLHLLFLLHVKDYKKTVL